jgi:hypothetical protein
MIEHVWSVLCERILVDRKNTSASYINTFNAIPVRSVDKKTGEISLRPFIIVTKLHKTDTKDQTLSTRFSLKLDEDQTLMEIAKEDENLDGRTIFAELNIEINQMTVKQEGDYRLLVDIKSGSGKRWKNVASIPFIVRSKKSLKSYPINNLPKVGLARTKPPLLTTNQ